MDPDLGQDPAGQREVGAHPPGRWSRGASAPAAAPVGGTRCRLAGRGAEQPVGVRGRQRGDAVGPVRIQSGEGDPTRRPGEGVLHGDQLVERLGPVLGDHPVEQERGVGQVRVDDPTGVQQAAQPLVQRDPLGQRRPLGRRGRCQVPLHAHVAPQGRPGPEGQVVDARRGVVRAGPHVGPHQLGGQRQAGPADHALALVGVDAVRDPHPVRVLHDAEVQAGPAGGAGLDLQPGVPGLELGHQPVGRLGLGVDPGGARRVRARRPRAGGCGPTSGRRSGTRRSGSTSARARGRRRAGSPGRGRAGGARPARGRARSRAASRGARGPGWSRG